MKIVEIRLLTSQLDSLKEFYSEVLGFSVSDIEEESFTVYVGAAKLTFTQCETEMNPYYHFAFNIVESKIGHAIDWLKNRGILINQIGENDVYYSESWNSHSVYFYDSAGNIVEFIARHNLVAEQGSEFTVKDVLNISEIGLPAQDVIQLSTFLKNELLEEIYIEGNSIFTPIGNEEGLLILSSLQRNWLGSNKKVEIFPLEIVVKTGESQTNQLLQYPYKLTTI